MTIIETSAQLQPKVERFFADYVRLLDDHRYQEWLDLFAEQSFYGVIRYEDHCRDNDFFIVSDTKDKLRIRVKLGNDTDTHMRVHLITGPRLEDVAEGAANASCNFGVFRDNALLYSGKYLVTLTVANNSFLKIKRWVAVITNQQPNDLLYLPI